MTARPRDAGWFAGAALVLAVAVLVGASIGPAGPPWWRVPLALIDHLPLISFDSGVSQSEWNILWKIRMPRVILGGLVGGMLSIAGASYQGVFRNPLVDPYLLGVAAGAGLGATIALTTGRGVTAAWPVDPVPTAAFVMALVTVGITYAVGTSRGVTGSSDGGRSGTTLVLAGIAVVSFATAVQTFILQRNNEVVREVFQWVLGRLSGATWSDVMLIAPYVIISSIVLIMHRRQLDLFRVGDVEAATLGMSVSRSRLIIVVTATLGHRGGGVGERPDRVRRARDPARDPPRGGSELPAVAATVVDVGRRVPDPRRHPRSHADQPGGDADRGGHGVHRCAVLHLPAADPAGAGVSVIEFREVVVRYDKRIVVQPFSDRVESGEWLGLIGPNGAGKSSLLRALAGLVPHDGAIVVDGRDLASLPNKERAKLVAYVPQEPLIPDDMSVFDYVLLGRTPYVSYFGVESRRDREVVAEAIERLELATFVERLLGELSGGERQRVVLARALAQQAPVLLLDEPTSALDIGHQQQALELVAQLRHDEGLTVIAAMHDLTLAGTYTDRLTMIDQGVVVASGHASEVLTADRLGEIYHVCVTVDIDDDGTVIVVPRRGFPAP